MNTGTMIGTGDSRIRGFAGRRSLAVLLGALLCAAAVALPALALQGGNQVVRPALSGFGAERIKTVPIAKRSGGKPRVAMSLSPAKVGDVGAGDAIWAGAEIELSVTCLEAMPQCVGSRYRYSPHIKARLVLASSSKGTGRSTTPITKAAHMRCSQEQPNRNHHCVMTVDGSRQLKEGSISCGRCWVNLVIDAYHHSARGGNVIVVGSDDDHGIEQDKGMINSVVFDPGPIPDGRRVVESRSTTGHVPIGGRGGNGPRKVIFSRRVDELREGEVLVVKAKAIQKIGHLPYHVLMQSQLILSEKRTSTRHRGIPGQSATHEGVITAQNGFNCTQGHSGHSNPCAIRKVGLVKMLRDARTKPKRGEGPFVPLFVNLVVQNREIGDAARLRAGGQTNVSRKGGFIEVRRYGP
jgi:hypothetical protein